jgi:hypothetical protein
VWVVLATALTVAAVPPPPPPPPPPPGPPSPTDALYVSWTSRAHRFGWTWETYVPGACSRHPSGNGRATLCATEDGGRHWRAVLRLPQRFVVFGQLRWSRRAGIAAVQTGPGRAGHAYYWTVDGGRRWFRISTLPLPVTCSYAWEGPRTFCGFDVQLRRASTPVLQTDTVVDAPTEHALHRVYRLRGWPPRSGERCVSGWRNVTGAKVPWRWASRRGNVCLDRSHDGGIRAEFSRQFVTTG